MPASLTRAWALSVCWITIVLAEPIAHGLPDGFVDVQQAIPTIKIDLRYFSAHNFVGERINGYQAPRAILTQPAAKALERVQQELALFGLGLKLFDAYRPQQAVEHFVRWARDVNDTRMKAAFYPDVAKLDLFKEGYIAEKSSHSRGSTVDLTLAPLNALDDATELDMGTPFDWFGPESWPDSAAVTPSQRAHRLLLRTLMEKHGFQPYAQEWWHFTLAMEPFPDTYFDFPVQ
ncbi:MAG: M15 family metallopeptidase [Candidatus Competibacteraceae bacterium]|nr:M15 family metallopeptidase [Candidatus Competibacteraceae bacterium]MCB1822146.1 M15 family metallopeptidase [Candidatus Competibacteraceae bacterium]HRY15097.1 M15 family metallopeptidase [Candidatus Competibacteraceae bacterium]